MKRTTVRTWILLGCALPLIWACEGVIRSVKDTLGDSTKVSNKKTESVNPPTVDVDYEKLAPAEDKTPAPVYDFLLDTSALRKAEQALRGLPQFAGKNIRLYKDIHFYDDGRVMLKLQHPGNPEYIDEYRYQEGSWSGPEPVQISVRTPIENYIFDLDSMRFETVATIARHYNEKASSVEGAEAATHVYGIIWDKDRFIWYPRSINGSRERFGIEFTLDGAIKTFKRE